VSIKVDRTVPHSAAFVDHITIDLGATPAGAYELTLEITDAASGQTQTRKTRFVVRR
jgi:hypothetical protein